MVVNRLELTRGIYGGVLLSAPRVVAVRVLRMPPAPHATTVVKLLGARQITQALVTGFPIARRLRPLGAVVGVLHCLSMVALAALSRTYRRAALTDAVIAGAFATLEFRNNHSKH